MEGSKAEDIVVESDLYKVTFSTRGAVVENWILKRYRDAKEAPLDLIDDEACGKLGFPMSLKIADGELANKLNSALYVATPAGGTTEAARLRSSSATAMAGCRRARFSLSTRVMTSTPR